MSYKFTRMSSLALAFGIFFNFSCSNLKNTESPTPSGADSKSIQEEIREINRELSDNPDNEQLQVKKANLLYQYSQNISDPSSRKPVYSNIRNIAEHLFTQSDNASASINEVLLKAWRIEQRSGIDLLQEDQSERPDEENIEKTIAHFENAITLIPDSLKTYHVLATTHYQHGNLNKAIETLELAELQSDQPKPEIREKLAYLFLESGNLVEAEQRYSQLVESYPEEMLYKHGLINVFILSDKHQQAIALLEELSEEYPTRYNYQQSLATELYYQFKNRTDEYLQNGEQLSEDDLEELTNLLNSAHSIFESVQESLPTTEENLYRIAAFYKNASIRLRRVSANNEGGQLSELQSEYMEYSLPLWERLAEMNPENLGYIRNLYEVYLELGMNEDAESLERSYNF
ncbi:MAG: hypothetical protein R3220_05095 [Balneolaceae bacterium]|nr:hypothetical protein [Balneolaceae bacterium]